MIDDPLGQNSGRAAADDRKDSPDARELPPGESEPATSPEVEALRQDLALCQDRLLRSAAEFDNYRKRTGRERREQADRTVSNVLLDLVGVLDDLERAMSVEAGGGSVEAYRAGVELIHRKIVELLKRRDVRPIEAVGAPFDPNLHQAVTTEVAEGHADGEVLEELRRGYMIGERLLRPAMVKVART